MILGRPPIPGLINNSRATIGAEMSKYINLRIAYFHWDNNLNGMKDGKTVIRFGRSKRIGN